MIRSSSLVLLGAVLLAGCASQPEEVGMASPPGGTWIITDAFPAGAVTDAASAPRGQLIRMDAAMAGDAAGRLCPWPSYRDTRAPLGTVVGGSGGRVAEDTPVLEIDCAGQPFARYAVMGDGSLLGRHGPWLLRLEHGEKLAANPAPMMPEPPMMSLPPAAPEPPASPPVAKGESAVESSPAATVSRTLVYLASYRTETWAKKGWSILAGRSASLKTLQPVTRGVEIKGKGKFVRLFAAARDAAEGKRVCQELGKTIAECGTAGRDG